MLIETNLDLKLLCQFTTKHFWNREVHWILPSWQVAELRYEHSLPIKILCIEELYYTDAIANVWLHMNSESLGTILWLFLDKANSYTNEESMADWRKWKDQNEESRKSDQCYSMRKQSQSFLSVSGSLPYIIWFSIMAYLWFHRLGLFCSSKVKFISIHGNQMSLN